MSAWNFFTNPIEMGELRIISSQDNDQINFRKKYNIKKISCQ